MWRGAPCALLGVWLGCAPADFDRQVGRVNEACEASARADGSVCESHDAAPIVPDAGATEAGGARPEDARLPELDSRVPGDAQPPDGELPSDGQVIARPDDGSAPAPPVDDAGTDATVPQDAALDASPPSCGNLISDPMNCGGCGNVCSAASATVSCMNAMCVRSCQSGYDDCDRDLVHGVAGNGCETAVVADLDNCGLCRRRCVPPSNGFASCEAQKCVGYTLVSASPQSGPLHGNEIGGVYFGNRCDPGEAVIGIGGYGETDAIWAVRSKCGRLRVARSGERLTISTMATKPTSQAGSTLLGASFDFDCPANMVVTSVAGSTIVYSGTSGPSLRSLTVGCSAIEADAKRAIRLVPGATYTVGTDTSDVFAETCGTTGVLVGFSGHAGNWIDGLRTECAPLEFDDGIIGSVMIPHEAAAP